MLMRARLSRLRRRSMVHLFFKTLIGMMVLAFAVATLLIDPTGHQTSQPQLSAGTQMMQEMTSRIP